MRYAVLATTLLLGCSARVTAIDLPDPADMKSMLVGWSHENDKRMFGFDLEAPIDADKLPDLESFSGEATLWAVFYRDPLPAVGLEAGEIFEVKDEATSRPLPEFAEGYVRAVPDDDDWGKLSGTAGAQIEFRIERGPVSLEHCPEDFGLQPAYRSPREESFHTSLTINDSLVYAFGEAGTLLEITPTGVTATSTSMVHGANASALAPNGDVWLGTYFRVDPETLEGRVYRGHPDRGFVEVAREASEIIAMAAPGVPGAVDELFYITNEGLIVHLREGTRVEYDEPLYAEGNDVKIAGAVWKGDGEAGMFLAKSYAAISEGSIREYFHEVTNGGDYAAMTTLANGDVLVLQGLGWFVQPTPQDGFPNGLMRAGQHIGTKDTFALIPYGPGFLYAPAGLSPIYGVLHEAQCNADSDQTFADFTAKTANRMGDHYVVIGSASNMRVMDRRAVILIGRAEW